MAVVVGDRQGLAVGAEVERADAPSMAEESGDLADIDLAEAKDRVGSKGDDVPPRDVHRSRPFEVPHGLVAPARATPQAEGRDVVDQGAIRLGLGGGEGLLGLRGRQLLGLQAPADPPVRIGPQPEQAEHAGEQGRGHPGRPGAAPAHLSPRSQAGIGRARIGSRARKRRRSSASAAAVA